MAHGSISTFLHLLQLAVDRFDGYRISFDGTYQRIQAVLDRNGNRCSPEEFRQIVNVVFHRYESSQYDELHRSMWESLPVVFDLLAAAGIPDLKSHAQLLDVGCGTGLSTTLLLNTPSAHE